MLHSDQVHSIYLGLGVMHHLQEGVCRFCANAILFYTEHWWILLSMGVLEPIPHGY
jgi:hypothetical protein